MVDRPEEQYWSNHRATAGRSGPLRTDHVSRASCEAGTTHAAPAAAPVSILMGD
jgi:hypothetical protein